MIFFIFCSSDNKVTSDTINEKTGKPLLYVSQKHAGVNVISVWNFEQLANVLKISDSNKLKEARACLEGKQHA